MKPFALTTKVSENKSMGRRAARDFYATDPIAATLLLENEPLCRQTPIWEPACGLGHLAEVFKKQGYSVFCSDIINRGYPCLEYDFLKYPQQDLKFNIVTNPPFNLAQEFIEQSLGLVADGCKVCMFLKLTFCEGKKRKQMFLENPPKTIYVSSSRITCADNGDFGAVSSGSTVAYAWFVWVKGFTGDTVVKWIN